MSSKLQINYGDIEKTFERVIRVNQTLRPNNKKAIADPKASFINAISEPRGEAPLIEKISDAKNIAIIIGDRRKISQQITILEYLLDLLDKHSSENVALFLASANRAKLTLEDIKLPSHIIDRFTFIPHDSHDDSKNIYVGVTKHNTQVRINKDLINYDLKIGIDIIRPHLFAGYTGGGQIILPGLSFDKTIEANHSMRVKEKCFLGSVEGNIVKDDMNEAAELIDNLFIINSVLNRDDDFLNITAGAPTEVFHHGIKAVRTVCGVPAKRTDIAIVSGSPQFTSNLYEAGKLLGAAGLVLNPSGIAILLAKCQNGTGNQEEFITNIYHKTLINYLPRDHKLYLVSDLPSNMLEDTIYKPFTSLEDAQEAAINELGKDATLSILHNTESLIPETV